MALTQSGPFDGPTATVESIAAKAGASKVSYRVAVTRCHSKCRHAPKRTLMRRHVVALGRPASAGRSPGTNSTTSSAVVRTGSVPRSGRAIFASIMRSRKLAAAAPAARPHAVPGPAGAQRQRPGDPIGVEVVGGGALRAAARRAPRAPRRRPRRPSGTSPADRRDGGARPRRRPRAAPRSLDTDPSVRDLDPPAARDVDARGAAARGAAARPSPPRAATATTPSPRRRARPTPRRASAARRGRRARAAPRATRGFSARQRGQDPCRMRARAKRAVGVRRVLDERRCCAGAGNAGSGARVTSSSGRTKRRARYGMPARPATPVPRTMRNRHGLGLVVGLMAERDPRRAVRAASAASARSRTSRAASCRTRRPARAARPHVDRHAPRTAAPSAPARSRHRARPRGALRRAARGRPPPPRACRPSRSRSSHSTCSSAIESGPPETATSTRSPGAERSCAAMVARTADSMSNRELSAAL